MEQTQQLLFDFANTPDTSASSYLPLLCHQNALQNLQVLGQQTGFRGLRIVGDAGIGKTHLLKAWSAVTGTAYTTVNDLPELPPQALAVDEVDDLSPQQQESLFHIYNSIQKQNGLLVIASTQSITPDSKILPDLRSRLLTLQEIAITQPTDGDLKQLLLKWAHDRQLTLKKEVVKYILTRADRSPAKLAQLVEDLDQHSMVKKHPITVPLLKDIFKT